jgi:hypothetical protein
MDDFEYHLLIRNEHNKVLVQEAVYERWLHSLGPLLTAEERFVQQWIRQAREWLDRQRGSFLCNEAVPACGLTPAG